MEYYFKGVLIDLCAHNFMQAKTFACTLHARSSLSVQFIDPWLHSISQETIGKNDPKWPKILFISLCISGTISHDCGLWYSCVKWYLISQGDFFGERGGVKLPKMTHYYPFQFATLYISGTVYHFWYAGEK